MSSCVCSLLGAALFCRCRLSKLVCSLLLLPQFPTALIGPLLLLQNHIWLQDDIRYCIIILKDMVVDTNRCSGSILRDIQRYGYWISAGVVVVY